MKNPLLDQMRSARQRRENEITAPYRTEIMAANRTISILQRRLREIEAFMGTEIARHVTERTGHEMSAKVWQLVMESAPKAKTAARDFTVRLPRDVMAFMDKRSIENEILSRYKNEALPRLSLHIDEAPQDCVTVIDIRVPQLGFRQAVQQRL